MYLFVFGFFPQLSLPPHYSNYPLTFSRDNMLNRGLYRLNGTDTLLTGIRRVNRNKLLVTMITIYVETQIGETWLKSMRRVAVDITAQKTLAFVFINYWKSIKLVGFGMLSPFPTNNVHVTAVLILEANTYCSTLRNNTHTPPMEGEDINLRGRCWAGWQKRLALK